MIDFPMLSDAESEASARDRCRKLWIKRYPKEPFDILPQIRKLATGQVYPIDEQSDDNNEEDEAEENQLVSAIARQSSFYFQVSKFTNL